MSSHTSSIHHSLMIAWARNLQAGAIASSTVGLPSMSDSEVTLVPREPSPTKP